MQKWDGVPLAVLRWWAQDPSSVAFGLGTGIVWGLATAGSTVPRGFVVEEGSTQSAYAYADTGLVQMPASVFLAQHYQTIVEVFATYFLILVLAGWVTWQWTRHRNARGVPAPLLRGTDRYLTGVLVGGSAGGLLFTISKMEALFRSAYPTLADVVVGALFVCLPAYATLASFLLWVRRKQLGRSQTAG